MKIVYIVNDLSGENGWSTYACRLIEEAYAQGYEVHVAVESEKQFLNGAVLQYPILDAPLSLLANPVQIFAQWKKIKTLIKSIQPDLVHVIVEPYIQAFAFSTRLSVPVILTMHGTYATLPCLVSGFFKHAVSRLLYMRALTRVCKVICVSKATREKFIAYQPYAIEDTVVIHNAIATIPSEREDSITLGIVPPAIITVGEVKRRKGIHDTIRLFSKWTGERKKYLEYHVVGRLDEQSTYVQTLRAQIEAIQSKYFKVVLHGQVSCEQKAKLLKNSMLYVHLERVKPEYTEVEGFGISIIEAAAYGVPALVAAGSATAEAVTDGVSGYIIDLDNEKQIFDRIDALLSTPTISKSNVVAWAQAHSITAIFKEIDCLYKKVTT